MPRTGFSEDFKRNFLTGIAALFPILVTLFLFTWLGRQLHATIGRRTNQVCIEVLARNPSLFGTVFPGGAAAATRQQREAYAREHFPSFIGAVVGLSLAVVAVYVLGALLRGWIGHRAVEGIDRFFERFPVIKAIYPHARQVGDFIFGQSGKRRFSNVVAVQYPRRGIYTVGFQTGEGVESVERKSGKDLVSVFIPTSPTPLTGFVIQVPAEEIIEVEMSVDEAFRYCITAGMLSSAKEADRPAALTRGANSPVPRTVEEQGNGEAAKSPEATPTPAEASEGTCYGEAGPESGIDASPERS